MKTNKKMILTKKQVKNLAIELNELDENHKFDKNERMLEIERIFFNLGIFDEYGDFVRELKGELQTLAKIAYNEFD